MWLPRSGPAIFTALVLQHKRAVVVEDETRLLRIAGNGIRQVAVEGEGAECPRQRRRVCRVNCGRPARSSWRGGARIAACGEHHHKDGDGAAANRSQIRRPFG